MNYLKRLYLICKSSDNSFLLVLLRTIYLKLVTGTNIVVSPNTRIKGLKKIRVNEGVIKVGMEYRGFESPRDYSTINIQGNVVFTGSFSFGRGCRIDVGKSGSIAFGKNSYISYGSLFIIMNRLQIGDNCAISWNCQFLDSDFHTICYDGEPKKKDGDILIGNRVWIGCNVKVYKNTFIADGCVIASDSIVKGKFTEKNSLIAGNPARVIKRNISWY